MIWIILHWLASSPLQHSRTTVRVFALPCECVISDNHIETETRITQITRHAIMTDKSHLIQLFKKKLLLSQFHNSITKTQFWKKYNYVCISLCTIVVHIYSTGQFGQSFVLFSRPWSKCHVPQQLYLVPFSSYLTLNNIVTLKSSLQVTQDLWK